MIINNFDHMRIISNIIGLLIIACVLGGCNPYYHSVVNPLVMRNKPDIESKIILKLREFDNVNLLDSTSGSWVYVKYYDQRGYVIRQHIAKGRAIVVTKPVRIGAICGDGSSVDSIAEDACNGRGGIRNWRTKPETTVRIKN